MRRPKKHGIVTNNKVQRCKKPCRDEFGMIEGRMKYTWGYTDRRNGTKKKCYICNNRFCSSPVRRNKKPHDKSGGVINNEEQLYNQSGDEEECKEHIDEEVMEYLRGKDIHKYDKYSYLDIDETTDEINKAYDEYNKVRSEEIEKIDIDKAYEEYEKMKEEWVIIDREN